MALARAMRWVLALTAVVVVIGAAVWMIPSGNTRGEIVTLGEGVTPLVIDEVGLIAVRAGDDVVVFRAFDRRSEPLEWCAVSSTLTTSRGGSVYDLTGQKLGGPAPSGLDRVEVVEVDGGSFEIRPDRLLDPILLPGGDELTPVPESRVSDGWLNRFDGSASYCPQLSDI